MNTIISKIIDRTIEVTDNLNDFSKDDLEMFSTFLWEAYRNINSELKKRETEKVFSGIINKYIKYHWSEHQYAIMFVRYADLSQIKELGDTQKYIRLKGVGFKSHTNCPYWDDNYVEFDTDFELKVSASAYYEANKYRVEHPNIKKTDYNYWNDRIDEITEEDFINEYNTMSDNSTKTFEYFCKKIKEELNSEK